MWVDLVCEEIRADRGAPYVVNDAWTPSGLVHVGSLRGVILHDAIARGLREAGEPVRFLYGFDDYDPMDGLPQDLPKEIYAPHMGKPLCDVPSPVAGAASFAAHYASEFEQIFRAAGCAPEVYYGSVLYRSGRFNAAIRVALERAEEIVAIEREITGSKRAERHPIQMLCERCGRIGTTVVTAWDRDRGLVHYECRPDKVTWAAGCGHAGARSPFDGGCKMAYRTEWAAKWKILGVSVEGAGKDHMTKGGTHDTASALAARIFGVRVPFPIPYEWFLVGGKKMSSSAGRGLAARDLLDVLRPELVRFLIVRSYYRSAINFDPGGETIPRLYDEFDRAAAAFAGQLAAATPGEAQDVADLARSFHYASLTAADPAPLHRPRFAKVASLVQMPHIDLAAVIEAEKGTPLTAAERAELAARVVDAKRWLDRFAPDSYKFSLQETLPDGARAFSDDQRTFVARLADLVEADVPDGERLHQSIHALKTEMNLTPRDVFGAIYTAFLGKSSGPAAGWFLAALDRAFVVRRLREAAGATITGG